LVENCPCNPVHAQTDKQTNEGKKRLYWTISKHNWYIQLHISVDQSILENMSIWHAYSVLQWIFFNAMYDGKPFHCRQEKCNLKLQLPTYNLAVLVSQILLPRISRLFRCTAQHKYNTVCVFVLALQQTKLTPLKMGCDCRRDTTKFCLIFETKEQKHKDLVKESS